MGAAVKCLSGQQVAPGPSLLNWQRAPWRAGSAVGLPAGGADDDLVEVDRGGLFEREHDRAGDVTGSELGFAGAAGIGLPGVGKPGLDQGDPDAGCGGLGADGLGDGGDRPFGGGI